jgi:hypothetical protein
VPVTRLVRSDRLPSLSNQCGKSTFRVVMAAAGEKRPSCAKRDYLLLSPMKK